MTRVKGLEGLVAFGFRLADLASGACHFLARLRLDLGELWART